MVTEDSAKLLLAVPNVTGPVCQHHIIDYCKTVYFRCILISRFWIVEIPLHFNLAFSHCSTSIYLALMGKLNFRGYVISRFYPTREIRENLMHAKNTCFTVYGRNVNDKILPPLLAGTIITHAEVVMCSSNSVSVCKISEKVTNGF